MSASWITLRSLANIIFLATAAAACLKFLQYQPAALTGAHTQLKHVFRSSLYPTFSVHNVVTSIHAEVRPSILSLTQGTSAVPSFPPKRRGRQEAQLGRVLPRRPTAAAIQSRSQALKEVVDLACKGRQSRPINVRPLRTMIERHRLATPATELEAEDMGRSLERLLEAIKEVIDRLEASDVCDIIEVFMKFGNWDPHLQRYLHGPAASWLDVILQHALHPDVLSTMDSQQTARLIFAVGHLSPPRPEVIQALAWHLLQSRPTGHEISVAITGMAKSHFADGHILEAMADYLVQSGLTMTLDAQSVSMVAWAFARLNVVNWYLINALVDRILQDEFLASFNPQHLTNVVWAYATLGVHNEELFRALSIYAVKDHMPGSFSPRNLANFLWAYAKVGVLDETLMDTMGVRICSEPFLDNSHAPDIANIVWAYAKLGVRNDVLFNGLANHILQPQVLSTFEAKETASSLWAYATVGFRNEALMSAMAAYIMNDAQLHTFRPSELTQIAWAYATLDVKHTTLLRAIWDYILHTDLLAAFKAPELAATTWAYMKFEEIPLIESLTGYFVNVSNTAAFLKAHELADMVWVCARLGIQNRKLMHLLAGQIMKRKNVNRLTSHELVHIAWGYTVLQFSNKNLMQVLAGRLLQQEILETLTAEEISKLVRIYSASEVYNPQLLTVLAKHQPLEEN